MTDKQKLALKRGLFKRNFVCCKAFMWNMMTSGNLTEIERRIITDSYLIFCKLSDYYLQSNIDLGLNSPKISNKHITEL